MLTQSPAGVPSIQSRTWSIAAFAADAADDEPRASMTAAPRCCTVGMNVVLDPRLVADHVGRVAAADLRRGTRRGTASRSGCPRSSCCVTSATAAPVFAATWALARLWSSRVIAVKRSRPMRRRVVHRDQAVGVGRVADDEHPHVARGAGRERLALHGEDRAVRLEQILALHALRAGPGTDEQRHVHAVERAVRVVGLRRRRRAAGRRSRRAPSPRRRARRARA